MLNPMVQNLLLWIVMFEIGKHELVQWGGVIINVEISCTTGVCWGLYSEGYFRLNVIHTWPLQVRRNSDPVYYERERLVSD